MSTRSIEDIVAAINGRLVLTDAPRPWSGHVRIDSREIQPGDIFVALAGRRHDGHEFVASALAAGAAFAIVRADRHLPAVGPQLLVQDPQIALADLAQWHRRQLDALIIGVTGSVGKTTTREMIHTLLCGSYHGVRSEKNYNNEIGLPLCLLGIEPDHEFAVLELGAARIGDVAHLARLALPEVGVITAIGPAHLATFGSLEGIMQGKGELLEALPTGGFAVLSGDCPRLRTMASRARCRTIFVGEDAGNHLRVSRIERTEAGWRFRVDGQDYRLPLSGRHNIRNALCAVAIGLEIGLSGGILADRLAQFVPIAGRNHVRQIGAWQVIDDAYNASPLAFHAALDTLVELRPVARSRRIVVAGDMLELGAAAQEEHRRLGERAGQLEIDRLIVTGEHADDVASGAISAGMPSHSIAAATEWEILLFMLECWLEPGDAILVKGSRGMRMERVVEWLEQAAGAEHRGDRKKCA